MTDNHLPASVPRQRGESYLPAATPPQRGESLSPPVAREQASGDELHSMAGASGPGGMAAGLASQAASRVRNAGQWLDDRGPGQVADEMQSFARRRPAVFLTLAAGAGLVAGRLTRGLRHGKPATH